MITLIITDMDGTFLNSRGDYNRALFAEVVAAMAQQGIHFAPCTGKQVDRVEALLDNAQGLAIIRWLERLPGEHIVIACTAACAASGRRYRII